MDDRGRLDETTKDDNSETLCVQKVKFQFHFYKMDKKLIVIDEPIIISG